MQLSPSNWLRHFNHCEDLSSYKLSPFYYKTNALTKIYNLSHHCLIIEPTQPYPEPPFILNLLVKMYKKWGMFHFFVQIENDRK